MSPLAAATPLADVLEKDLTSQVVQLARTLGYLRYHSWTSKHSPSGFPDEVLVRERVVFLELKRAKTRTTEPQREWLRTLLKADAEVYVVRPAGLQALALVLSARRDPLGGHLSTPRAREAEQQLLDELRRELKLEDATT